jgi:hypothetical protein
MLPGPVIPGRAPIIGTLSVPAGTFAATAGPAMRIPVPAGAGQAKLDWQPQGTDVGAAVIVTIHDRWPPMPSVSISLPARRRFRP